MKEEKNKKPGPFKGQKIYKRIKRNRSTYSQKRLIFSITCH